MVYLDFVHRQTGELVKCLGEMEIEEAEMRIQYDPTERYEVEPGVEVPVRYQIRTEGPVIKMEKKYVPVADGSWEPEQRKIETSDGLRRPRYKVPTDEKGKK